MSRLSRFLDRGRQVVDLTKMGIRIEKEEENIETLYANLGRVFYKVHEMSPEVMYEDLFRTIAGSERQLAYLKRETQLISGRGKCQKCDHALHVNDLYCSLCGHAIEKEMGDWTNSCN
ncbi:MAG: hypothetical protein FWG67_05200 [Defluviitaleaceae bacterium]|nr:hypothetical protein [Defluviitaleaceae bacterium]